MDKVDLSAITGPSKTIKHTKDFRNGSTRDVHNAHGYGGLKLRCLLQDSQIPKYEYSKKTYREGFQCLQRNITTA